MHQTHDTPQLEDKNSILFRGLSAAPEIGIGRPGLSKLLTDPSHPSLSDLAGAANALHRAYTRDIYRRDRSGDRLAALRAELAHRGLTGMVLPLTDDFQGEYLPLAAQRLTWLTGFSGSAGSAAVLADRAGVWSDGRYTLQLKAQVDNALFELHHSVDAPLTAWLSAHLKAGDRLGYDPWLHTPDSVARLAAAVDKAGAELVALDDNPIDSIWRERPPVPLAPVLIQEIAQAGEAADSKRQRIAQLVRDKGADAAVLASPDSIAWLLNIRGGDVPHNPLVLARAILADDGHLTLFVDPRKLSAAVVSHLGNAVTTAEPDSFGAALDKLGRDKRRVLADPATTPAWIFRRLDHAGAHVLRGEDPCILPKARKNAVELEGTRQAHRRDGAALVRFLRWLAETAPTGTLDELGVMEKLAWFRSRDPLFRDLSFSTIAGAGPNGAIVHYRSTPETNRPIPPGTPLLLDSGGQYIDGTTDVTRTLFVAGGNGPDPELQDRFTRVLQGHIALAMALFPVGTTGQQLDALARRPLWALGLDFDHGTGHGVGSYLCVHEGPQRIAKTGSTAALEPGMIISNEPGFYKTGHWGIRIENLVAVTEVGIPAGGERPMLGFETLTQAPIDRALIVTNLLSTTERAWLDAYHRGVYATLSPLLDDADRAWLKTATAPL